jgi:hypothetical protein
MITRILFVALQNLSRPMHRDMSRLQEDFARISTR